MRNILFISFLFATTILFAQKDTTTHRNNIVPVNVEVMAGNNRFALNTLFSKKFTPKCKFNLLSVTSAASAYNNDLIHFDFINITKVSYDIYRGIGVNLGLSLNSIIGFNPTVGLQYIYARPSILLILAPNINLSESKNLEAIAVLEFKPSLTEKMSLFTKLQGYYNYNPKGEYHQRSYLNARAGLTFDQLTFGAGINLDWYGPIKNYKQNFGVFLMYSFI